MIYRCVETNNMSVKRAADDKKLPQTFVSWGCRHSSVDSSALAILPPRVRVPSTQSMLVSIIVKFVLYLSCEQRTKINKNRPGSAHLKNYFVFNGGSLGLVAVGGDSCYEIRWFECQHRIPDGHFSHCRQC